MTGTHSRIFISYSRGGNGIKWKARLLRALHVFEQHHLIDVWEDGKLRIGSDWNDEIGQAINSACVGVLLLTKEALESAYILNAELPLLRECQQCDKLTVIPVICEPCNWRDHDWLRDTQSPNEAGPLSQLHEAAQDRILRELATDISAVLRLPARWACGGMTPQMQKPAAGTPAELPASFEG